MRDLSEVSHARSLKSHYVISANARIVRFIIGAASTLFIETFSVGLLCFLSEQHSIIRNLNMLLRFSVLNVYFIVIRRCHFTCHSIYQYNIMINVS